MQSEQNTQTEGKNSLNMDKINTPLGDLQTRSPDQLRVIRRNGTMTPYDASKIEVAMTKAFLAVEGGNAAASDRIHEMVRTMTTDISDAFNRRLPVDGTLHIEDIQDQVELALMRSGNQQVARSYVLYREERRQMRNKELTAASDAPKINVTLPNGDRAPLNIKRMTTTILEACQDLEKVEGQIILDRTLRNLFDGVPRVDVIKPLVMTARTLIETEADYTYVTSRLLLDILRSEALTFLGLDEEVTFNEMTRLYPTYLNTTLTVALS